MTRRGTMYHRKRSRSNAHTVTDEGNEEFYECIKDIVHHPAVLKMKDYPHHCETSCYQHCLNVAYYNFRICRFFHLDYRAAARAGMLHDLFLYDWREHTEKTGDHFHAMTHPKAALRNAAKYFLITPLEKEIILKHMWPVTLTPPTHWETFIITLTDKYCGSCEIGRYYSHTKIPKKPFCFLKGFLKKCLALTIRTRITAFRTVLRQMQPAELYLPSCAGVLLPPAGALPGKAEDVRRSIHNKPLECR